MTKLFRIQLLILFTALGYNGRTWGQLSSIGVAEVQITDALHSKAKQDGKDLPFALVAQSLDGQLIDRLQNTRKFKIVARSDRRILETEREYQGESASINRVEYLVITTIDDFQDYTETINLPNLNVQRQKRIIRLSAVARLYDVSSGSVLETVSIQLGPGDKDYGKLREIRDTMDVTRDGDLSDHLLIASSKLMADRIANSVIDALFPAKIIAITGTQITINRGDGLNISVGQTWQVFELGEQMTDPDTGEDLGTEEYPLGIVTITQVTPRFSRAKIVDGDGFKKGQILRLVDH